MAVDATGSGFVQNKSTSIDKAGLDGRLTFGAGGTLERRNCLVSSVESISVSHCITQLMAQRLSCQQCHVCMRSLDQILSESFSFRMHAEYATSF